MDKVVNTDLISVIIPAYNSERYIIETVKSVLNQSYSNFEIIIVNDGSTDNSTSVLLAHFGENNKIKLITQKNAGQAAARNTGVKNAGGKWLAFLDADDLWMPQKLERQVEVITNNSTIDLIFCGCISFSETTETKHPIWESGHSLGKKMFMKLFSASGITNSSVLVKKEIIVKAGYFNESTIQRGTEDYEMWLRLAHQNFTFYSMDEYLVKYRLHPQGIHNNRIRMLNGAIAALNQYLKTPIIPNIQRIKRYRDCYRELLKEQIQSNAYRDEIGELIKELKQTDSYGIITHIQLITILFLPEKWVLVLSQILYRLRLNKNLPF